MKPRLYFWKDMARDYARLLVNDHWHWCEHCRRPVEHALAPSDDGRAAWSCMDCGYADPAYVRLDSEGPSVQDS